MNQSALEKSLPPLPPEDAFSSSTNAFHGTPAGFWERFGAYVLDMVILWFIHVPVFLIFIGAGIGAAAINKLPTEDKGVLIAGFLGAMVTYFLISSLICFFYFGWFYKNKRATPGKLVLGLELVDFFSGKNVGFFRAFFRDVIWKMWVPCCVNWGWLFLAILLKLDPLVVQLSTLGLWGLVAGGYIMAGVTVDKRAVHDRIFGTIVIRK